MSALTGRSAFDAFLHWEAVSRDTIDFKKIYVDMADDLVAGLLLSQIVYWYLPSKRDGRSKLRISKMGHWWLAKKRTDWWDEVRITPRQFDRAVKVLEGKGIVIKKHFRFNGLRTIHLRINLDRFMELWQEILDNPPANPHLPSSDSGLTQSVTPESPNGDPAFDVWGRPLTETTPKNTSESTPQTTDDDVCTPPFGLGAGNAEVLVTEGWGQDKGKTAGVSAHTSSPSVDDGYQALAAIGVAEKKAVQLAGEHSPAVIQACIDEARRNDRGNGRIRNIPGYVVTLLDRGYGTVREPWDEAEELVLVEYE